MNTRDDMLRDLFPIAYYALGAIVAVVAMPLKPISAAALYAAGCICLVAGAWSARRLLTRGPGRPPTEARTDGCSDASGAPAHVNCRSLPPGVTLEPVSAAEAEAVLAAVQAEGRGRRELALLCRHSIQCYDPGPRGPISYGCMLRSDDDHADLCRVLVGLPCPTWGPWVGHESIPPEEAQQNT